MLHLVPLFMWVWQSVKHPSFPSSITLVHSSLQVQWHLSQTELWHKWHLSLAEKITIPRIEVPRDPNFKSLCQKEPACKGKTFVPSRFSCMRFSLYSLHLQVPCTENLICYVPFILSRSVIMFSLSVFSIIISKPWSHLIIAYKYHRSWYLFFFFLTYHTQNLLKWLAFVNYSRCTRFLSWSVIWINTQNLSSFFLSGYLKWFQRTT